MTFEGGNDGSTGINQPRETVNAMSEPKILSPYSKALYEESAMLAPSRKRAFGATFEEISRQVIDNYGAFEIEGNVIPYSKISVTPEVIRKIAATAPHFNLASKPEDITSNEADLGGENRSTFCLTAFQVVNNPMAVEDMAIDEFFRNIPRVASAMKRGEKVPKVDIYLLDLPTGFNGKVTPELINGIKKNGIHEYGKLFTEFVLSTIPQDPETREKYLENLRIRLHGVSMDSLADSIFTQLPPDVQRITQRLLDNPAGVHNPLNIFRSVQTGLGLAIEGALREKFDDTAKVLNAARQPFLDNIKETYHLPEEDKSQTSLKWKAFTAISLKLLKGSPLHLGDPKGLPADQDPANRGSFIRKGVRDPLSSGPLNLVRAWMRRKDPAIIEKKGKSLEFSVNKSHIFFYENFDRWAKNLDYCQKVLSKPPEA